MKLISSNRDGTFACNCNHSWDGNCWTEKLLSENKRIICKESYLELVANRKPKFYFIA